MCHQFTEMFGVVAVLVDDFLIVRNDETLVTLKKEFYILVVQ